MHKEQIEQIMIDAVSAVLQDFRDAYFELVEPTIPTITDTLEKFEFAQDAAWPDVDGMYRLDLDTVVIDGHRYNLKSDVAKIARRICEKLHYIPSEVLAATKKIESATAKCRHQAEIKRRIAEALLETQREEIEKLKSLAARLAKPQ